MVEFRSDRRRDAAALWKREEAPPRIGGYDSGCLQREKRHRFAGYAWGRRFSRYRAKMRRLALPRSGGCVYDREVAFSPRRILPASGIASAPESAIAIPHFLRK